MKVIICLFLLSLLAGLAPAVDAMAEENAAKNTDNNSVESYAITENETWKPIDTSWKDIEPGSALDFSFMQDAPAGKHGRVIIKEGRFSFEDGTPAKFYGTNLCGTANFLDKKGSEQLAERLAMMGYNAVRFHHCDAGMTLRGGKSSTELNPENMDRIDYLFYCLREKGIYISADLYISRPLIKGEIPELPDTAVSMKQFKLLVFALDSARKNWESFSRNMLEHVNPYTGFAWKNDPALTSISLVNEDVILEYAKDKQVKAIFEKLFAEWLEKNNLQQSEKNNEILKLKFLTKLYKTGYNKLVAYVRDLGVSAPLTDMNHWKRASLSAMRADFDYIDMHCYWDHPQFLGKGWSPPSTLLNRSVLSQCARIPLDTSLSRTFGKPMTISEFDYCTPNEFRAEGAAVMGAYAALQGWDALYRFAYAHNDKNTSRDKFLPNYFDVGADPLKALSERMAVTLFLRGDVRQAKLAYPVIISKNCADDPEGSGIFPDETWKLGLIGRTGNVLVDSSEDKTVLPEGSVAAVTMEKKVSQGDSDVPVFMPSKEHKLFEEMLQGGVMDRKLVDLSKRVFRSSTGEIELAQKKETFKVVTPMSEVLIAPEGERLDANIMSIENKRSRSVVFATALDGDELAESKRMLVLHLTDSHMSNMKFGNKKHTLYTDSGSRPVLVKDAETEISLKMAADKVKVFALDGSGHRMAEVPFLNREGKIAFNADVIAYDTPCLAYEVVR